MGILLKHIYNRLRKENWPALPSSLKDGKIGLILFFALYSKHTGNNRSRRLSAYIIFPESPFFPFSLSKILIFQKNIVPIATNPKEIFSFTTNNK